MALKSQGKRDLSMVETKGKMKKKKKQQNATQTRAMPFYRRYPGLLISLFLIIATVLLFCPVGNYQFLNYDDNEYITENPQVKGGLTLMGFTWAFTTTHAANWHPVTWLSHMLDCDLYGLAPGGHH